LRAEQDRVNLQLSNQVCARFLFAHFDAS
jgi:hypothetical protein